MSFVLAAALAVAVGAANTRSCIVHCPRGVCAAVSQPTRASCTAEEVPLCECPEGSCAGTDGACHVGQTNTEAGQVYRLRNARWPNWYLSLDDHKVHVKKGRTAAGRSSFRWTLQTPPPTGSGSGLYLLATEYKPDRYLGHVETSTCPNNGTDSDTPANLVESEAGPDGELPQGGEGSPLDASWHPFIRGDLCRTDAKVSAKDLASNGLTDLAVKLTHATATSPHAELLMLSPATKPGSFIFIGRYTSTAGLFDSDPGFGGYWFFDPALPAEVYSALDNFSGVPCTDTWSASACGSLGTPDAVDFHFIDAAPQQRGLRTWAAALALLASSCLASLV